MAAPSVPESAVHASLLFAVGQGRELPSSASDLDDAAATVRSMLQDQGTPGLAETVLDTIRAGYHAAEHDPETTVSARRYDQLRRAFLDEHGITAAQGRTVWPVGSTTILKRAGGSWSRALREAGLGASTKRRSSAFGSATFTAEQCSAAVQEFRAQAAASGTSPSYQKYTAWRKSQQERGRTDLPSGPALRNRFSTWKAALAAAAPED